MNKNSKSKSLETINKIIKSSKQLFKDFSYQETTMQMIADKSGISKSLLTHYFPKKNFILTTINKTYLQKIENFIRKQVEDDDALLIMLMTYKIFFRNILADEDTKIFWRDTMARGDRSMMSYSNSDSLYVPVFKQFNTMLSERGFVIRKIQIMGASTELTRVYFNREYDISDKEFIDQSLIINAMLLGANNYAIINCMQKSDELLAEMDYSQFMLLE